ncbi:hypothetical protein SDRG_00473 [Saprolegnia diclina VS20]|uniref:Uncharacterized protein n=1 Tax=Saprolegnia diclina (strain VS20) TaxID=1156394 RepID=T0R8F1_SAPDV|nr:hypothetical protein SDRG_00473 [Saprolegnia diclina VS20]EQC42750.1 hypothetical protein SDRG_00473 [Saprolegnia diclina VS20]|eukprot:XP_008604173.1 hypothetical protein SDRG_00473 [Saprolegnia diclina VS20]
MLINTQYTAQNPSQSYLPVLEGEPNAASTANASAPQPFGDRSDNALSGSVMDLSEKVDEGLPDDTDDVDMLLDESASEVVVVPRSLLALDLAGL